MMDTVKGYFALINEYYSNLLEKEIIIAYDGDVTHQVMKAFTSLVEHKLISEHEKETVIRRLYHILVECLQNINRHAEGFYPKEHVEDYPGRGALLVSKSDAFYRVITANLVRTEHAAVLKTFLDQINPLNRAELNEYYKTQLMNGDLSSKGGAGLGFIDIRRKTSRKLDFHFVDFDGEYSFFLCNVTLAR
jgi:hypothetical protein